jgi:hypothetical protein
MNVEISALISVVKGILKIVEATYRGEGNQPVKVIGQSSSRHTRGEARFPPQS